VTIDVLNPGVVQEMPKAVLLDFDNTIYAYDPPHKAAMAYVRRAMIRDYSLPEADFDAQFARARDQVKSLLGATAASHNRLLYFKRTLELLGLGSQIQAALNLEQLYWRTFFSQITVFPGVVEFLDDLRLAAIPLAVITDLTAQIQLRKIVYLGLDHYLDVVVTSEEAGADKPDPRLFHVALEKLLVKERPVWFIGDNPTADMLGAKKAIGAVTLQKLHDGVVPASGEGTADVTFNEYAEIRLLLARLTGR
jgi:putative hydrolase of the HAD superfamily